jgi:hypothetical protein
MNSTLTSPLASRCQRSLSVGRWIHCLSAFTSTNDLQHEVTDLVTWMRRPGTLAKHSEGIFGEIGDPSTECRLRPAKAAGNILICCHGWGGSQKHLLGESGLISI